jgi:hypothetical protein
MSEMQSFSKEDVAQFMFEEIQKRGFLDQNMVATQIKDKFGPEFVSITEEMGLSIKPEVRKLFKNLVAAEGQKAEWSSGDKCWSIWPMKKLKDGQSPSEANARS